MGVLSLKTKEANKPAKTFSKIAIDSGKAAEVIKANVEDTYYRRDLTKLALARAARLAKTVPSELPNPNRRKAKDDLDIDNEEEEEAEVNLDEDEIQEDDVE